MTRNRRQSLFACTRRSPCPSYFQPPAPSLPPPMAKCEEGYLCDVCGGDVEEITDSDLYLRYVIGLLDPETLHTTRERHIRCNPVLAQFIVDADFEPVTVEGDFDKRLLDPAYVRERESLVSRGFRRLREVAASGTADHRLSAAGGSRPAGGGQSATAARALAGFRRGGWIGDWSAIRIESLAVAQRTTSGLLSCMRRFRRINADAVPTTADWSGLKWGAAVVLLAAIVYWPTLNNGFIWDDDAYVLNNVQLRTLDGLYNIWFRLGAVPQYYPLVHTTFWLEYHAWGLYPTGYHLTNLALHICQRDFDLAAAPAVGCARGVAGGGDFCRASGGRRERGLGHRTQERALVRAGAGLAIGVSEL